MPRQLLFHCRTELFLDQDPAIARIRAVKQKGVIPGPLFLASEPHRAPSDHLTPSRERPHYFEQHSNQRPARLFVYELPAFGLRASSLQ